MTEQDSSYYTNLVGQSFTEIQNTLYYYKFKQTCSRAKRIEAKCLMRTYTGENYQIFMSGETLFIAGLKGLSDILTFTSEMLQELKPKCIVTKLRGPTAQGDKKTYYEVIMSFKGAI